ncbi:MULTISPECIES: hypothetical protein [unclassified Lactococcus]|uniref:hypothetical protein n=1 Tax=unclassified Lactococcus TaxID=2643510 RepID=UPI0012975F2A|nr:MULTISPECIES: hypothetical protein [unclassified Lactococcus]MQW24070.1 hypothetical protein [Lactococcus sp. dk101]
MNLNQSTPTPPIPTGPNHSIKTQERGYQSIEERLIVDVNKEYKKIKEKKIKTEQHEL